MVQAIWREWLTWAVVFFLSAAAAGRFICNLPETPALVQSVVALAFGLVACRGVLLIAEAADLKGRRGWGDWPYYVPVAAYSLLWGRHNFLGFVYYDEISRFSDTRLSPIEFLCRPHPLRNTRPGRLFACHGHVPGRDGP